MIMVWSRMAMAMMSVARSDATLAASCRYQQGVTLIEALVTFFILSVGLLGVVSLLVLSKSSQHQAVQRSRAVLVASDILERIRANPAGFDDYVARDLSDPLGGGSIEDSPAQNCLNSTCTATQLAAFDLWQIERQLDGASVTVDDDGVEVNAGGLKAARACILEAAAGTPAVTVILQWRGLTETSDAVAAGGAVCGGASASTDGYRRQLSVSSFMTE